jgi:hypothetical protein
MRQGSRTDSPWVFPAPTASGHVEQSSIKKLHAKACKVAGVEYFAPYTLRHTCLTRWATTMDPYTWPTSQAIRTSLRHDVTFILGLRPCWRLLDVRNAVKVGTNWWAQIEQRTWRAGLRKTCKLLRRLSQVARPEGLEPPAYWFEANRSIQLSYGRVDSFLIVPPG